ncbi:MAG: hypothetical protein Q9162_006075 [Coniocarpon cinnabarinum]
MFRSYDRPESHQEKFIKPRLPLSAGQVPLWQIARGTMSRPKYFGFTTIDGVRYADGGFYYRNPNQEIIWEVDDLNGKGKKGVGSGARTTSMDCLVSIGCGLPGKVKTEINHYELQRRLMMPTLRSHARPLRVTQERVAALDSDDAHINTRCLMSCLNAAAYFRLNPASDICDLPHSRRSRYHPSEGSEDPEGFAALEKEIKLALRSSPLAESLSNCARRLVHRRHAKKAE